ncbi:unnamed protein product [Allacma fusca]|uniref:Peptidase S1 domain-containing protein n=1 Tax=Allacma fusca TaxID=39272 RepID=A0A8J2P830_9HEXA|nr:unnamed protein product [Allacma fusca]
MEILIFCFGLVVLGSQGAHCFLPSFPSASLAANPAYSSYLNFTLDEDRIVGGEEAKEGQFKYQASLQRRTSSGYSHYCGASLVSSSVVVTAAHCVHGRNAGAMQVLLGSLYVSGPQAARGSRYNVSRAIVHENYVPSTVANDIALLLLSEPVLKKENIEPVLVPTFNAELDEKTDCIVSGWGVQEEGGRVARTLRYVNVPIVSDTECKLDYSNQEITESMICAGLTQGGKDSCQGDSGGPLVSNGRLVGIVSWGYGCARPGYPGVYTKVSLFAPWIATRMATL